MNLLTIPLRCMRAKWLRAAALFVIFLLGVASVLTLYNVSALVGEGFEQKLASFGANIILSPHREQLTVSYGGIPMGAMNLDDGLLEEAEVRSSILSIGLRERIAVIAPKLLGVTRYMPSADSRRQAAKWAAQRGVPLSSLGTSSRGEMLIPYVGVDFENELNLKQFWSVLGEFPGGMAPETVGEGMRLPFTVKHMDHSESSPADNAMGQAAAQHSEHSMPTAIPSEADTWRLQGFSTAPEGAPTSGTTKRFQAVPLGEPSAAVIPEGAFSAVLGSNLAGQMGLVPGSVFHAGAFMYYVHGVLAPTGSDDDGVMFLPLEQAQTVSGKHGKASFVEVAALCSGCPIEAIVAELQHALPDLEIKALQQVVAQRLYSVHFASSLALLVALVILLSGCAMVVTSMLSAVNERQREIGLLRAVGHSRCAVFIMFAFEAMCIGVLAGLVGYFIGVWGALQILTVMDMAVPGTMFVWYEWLLCGLFSGVVASVAAFFPAWKAAMAEPVAALGAL